MSASLAARARLVQELVPIACRLVGAVRDGDIADVAGVLASVPDGRHDGLLVVVAAMVDPNRTARELLAWVPEDEPLDPPAELRGLRTIETPESIPAEDPAELPGEREFARLIGAGVPALPASHLVDAALRHMRGDVPA